MRRFKLDLDEVMFTADTHFGHANIIKHCRRPFKDAHHMNEVLIENWNRVVSPKQLVFHLGDFGFKSRQTDNVVIRTRLNGTIILVRGNHDYKRVETLFSEVHDLVEVTVGEQRIVLCHYAMRSWNGSHRGSWQLYGHSHGTVPPIPGVPSFDIGVDSWGYKPASFQQVANAMKLIVEAGDE